MRLLGFFLGFCEANLDKDVHSSPRQASPKWDTCTLRYTESVFRSASSGMAELPWGIPVRLCVCRWGIHYGSYSPCSVPHQSNHDLVRSVVLSQRSLCGFIMIKCTSSCIYTVSEGSTETDFMNWRLTAPSTTQGHLRSLKRWTKPRQFFSDLFFCLLLLLLACGFRWTFFDVRGNWLCKRKYDMMVLLLLFIEGLYL